MRGFLITGVLALTLIGCGSDDTYYGGSPAGNANNNPGTADTGTVLFQPSNIQARALTSDEQQALSSATSLKFVGLGGSGAVYGPVRVANTNSVRLTDVPTSVRRLLVVYSAGSRVVGASVVPLAVNTGGETRIDTLKVAFSSGNSGSAKPGNADTQVAFGTADSSSLRVQNYVLSQTPRLLPLPDNQSSAPDITVANDGPAYQSTNNGQQRTTSFTIPTGGDYLVDYTVHTAQAGYDASGLVDGSGSYISGTRVGNTNGNAGTQDYSFSGVITLPAGSKVSLGITDPNAFLGQGSANVDFSSLTITQVTP